MVNDLANELKLLPNIKLWIAEYYSPQLYKGFQSPAFSELLKNSPFRFFPKDWFSFFKKAGWIQKEFDYLYDEGIKQKRAFPLPWWSTALKIIFGQRALEKQLRLQGYVFLKRLSNQTCRIYKQCHGTV